MNTYFRRQKKKDMENAKTRDITHTFYYLPQWCRTVIASCIKRLPRKETCERYIASCITEKAGYGRLVNRTETLKMGVKWKGEMVLYITWKNNDKLKCTKMIPVA
jgi:hypothetical protein